MPFFIERNNILELNVDAIVNPTNNQFKATGGLDKLIHDAAGKKLDSACQRIGQIRTGEAVLTKGYALKAKYVIHTVGPIWHGGGNNEIENLKKCYRESLEVARKQGIQSIAFPLISTGAYRFPKDKALLIAKEMIFSFLKENDMLINLVVYDSSSFQNATKLFKSVDTYINEKLIVESYSDAATNFPGRYLLAGSIASGAMNRETTKHFGKFDPGKFILQERSFSETLFSMIDERDMKDSEVYKRANIDRRHFSKIRSKASYHPQKSTAVAFAIALRLNIDETNELLASAGYILTNSSKADIIVRFYIENYTYDIYEINETLFCYGQKLLGVNVA